MATGSARIDSVRTSCCAIIAATGTTLKLALFATFLGALVGFTLGAVSSVLSPRLRNVLVRLIDAFVAFPAILVAIFVGVIIGPGETGAWLGVGIALSFSMARVASTLAASIAGQEFVAAARVLGVSRLRQFRKYILPNIAETLFVIVSVSISSAIVFISSLSFLGLGVQPPKNDWGRMLIEGVQSFYTNGAAALGPARGDPDLRARIRLPRRGAGPNHESSVVDRANRSPTPSGQSVDQQRRRIGRRDAPNVVDGWGGSGRCDG